MKEHGRHIRTITRLILFAVCVNAAVQHLDVVAHAIAYLLGVAAPILLGLFAAFILTIPINALEKHLIRPHGKRALKLQKKLQRPLSIALSILLIVAAIAFVSIAVIPNLASSLHSMIVDLPALLEQFKEASLSFREQSPGLVEKIQNMSFDAIGFESALSAILTRNMDSVADAVIAVATSVFGKAFSAMLGLIIAISAACQKERLAAQAICFVQTFFAERKAEKTISLVRRVRNIFANFITRQVLEAMVLGGNGVCRHADLPLPACVSDQRAGDGDDADSHPGRMGFGDRGRNPGSGIGRTDPGVGLCPSDHHPSADRGQHHLSPRHGKPRWIALALGAGSHHTWQCIDGRMGNAAVCVCLSIDSGSDAQPSENASGR